MANKPRLSPAEQEVQDYLAQASAGQAGIDPKAQTLARSIRNPRQQRLGQQRVDQQLKQNEANREDAASEAERAAKDAAQEQERVAKAQAAEAKAEQARYVRAAAEAGVQTKTDVETGRRDVKRRPNGDLMWEVGPTGPVDTIGVTRSQWKDEAGNVFGGRGSDIMLGGDGATGANTGETKAVFAEPIRDDRGRTRLVDPEAKTKTDKETGFSYVPGTDKTTGLPTKTVVGVDEAQRRANALGEKMQSLDLRENAVKQHQAQFQPKWEPIEKEYARAKTARETVGKTVFEKRNNTWVKINRSTGAEEPASVQEADAWRKTKEQAEGEFKRAERQYMDNVETAGNLERNTKAIQDEKLKLTEEKIRLDSGLPPATDSIAFPLAEAEVGPSPATEAAQAAADEVIPPEAPKAITESEALTKAFGGILATENVTLQGTEAGYSFIMRDGLSIGRLDNRGGDPDIILDLADNSDLRNQAAIGQTGGSRVFLADGKSRMRAAEEAQWAANAIQIATAPAANPMQADSGGAAGATTTTFETTDGEQPPFPRPSVRPNGYFKSPRKKQIPSSTVSAPRWLVLRVHRPAGDKRRTCTGPK